MLSNLWTDKNAAIALQWSALFWCVVTAVGQWIFAVYIVLLYVISAFHLDFDRWNHLPHGYDQSQMVGNAFLGAHLFFAAFICLSGTIQLVPYVRKITPVFHRINGRLYLFTALIMSASGLYLILSGRKLVGDSSQHIAISINALLILICSVMALRYAVARKIVKHKRWALRLFMAVSGVWLFGVVLMLWLVINGKPVGFDPSTFSGIFLTLLAYGVYVLPIILLELYFQSVEKGDVAIKYFTAASVCIVALALAVGVFGATMGMWLPRIT